MKQKYRDELPAHDAELLKDSKFALVKSDGWGVTVVAHGNDPIAVSCANKPFVRDYVKDESGVNQMVNIVQDGDKTVVINERDIWPGHDLVRIDER
jgi:hypothetical protein